MNILRFISAVAIGFFIGGLAIWAGQMLAHYFFPVAEEMDLNNPEVKRNVMMNAKGAVLWLLILSYALGSFIAGLLAHFINRQKQNLDATLVALLLMSVAIASFVKVPHPLWMMTLSILLFVPAALTGAWVARKSYIR